ncbi:hypothetical protein SGCOL_008177 [Colletotrichum sp. CLE4]
MMCSDAGGVPTISGKEIAEWVMNNRATLDLKYVIWGQKIWNPSQDSVKSWSGWRSMDDRGDFTANHCFATVTRVLRWATVQLDRLLYPKLDMNPALSSKLSS